MPHATGHRREAEIAQVVDDALHWDLPHHLDPALVLAGTDIALAGADKVLAENDGHPGHIFNLGHGVQPDTDPGVLTAIVAHVHERTSK